MALSKSSVRQFLNQPIENFDWVKTASQKQLDRALSSLDPKPEFHTTPFLHQKAAFYIGVCEPGFLFFLDLGLGKTKIVLDIIKYFKSAGLPHRALVLVPNLSNIDGWYDEIEIHQPSLKPVLLKGQTVDRQLKLDLNDNADLYIVNYPGLNWLCCELKEGVKGKKKKLNVSASKLKSIKEKFDILVLDESTAIKNHRSTTYKVCNKLSIDKQVINLTGTPFGRNPADLWSQFYIVDRGETLGETLGMFREAFCKQKINHWTGFPEYVFDKDKEEKLYNRIRNRSIAYTEDECPDLPDRRYIKIRLNMSDEQLAYYKDEIEIIRQGVTDYQAIKNTFIKLRMICSGFMRYRDDDNNVLDIEFAENERLDALTELILEMPSSSKMVIFYEYVATGNLIAEKLDELKIQYERLWSGTKDHGAALKKFKNNKKCRILINNNKSGSYGLNLQVANYVAFYETPVSPIDRRQAEKRCHRKGQTKTVFYYDFIMTPGVDAKILSYIKEGNDLFQALVKGREKWE